MIDTHSHVATNLEELDFVILAASNIEDSKENLEVAKSNNKLLPAIGIHPQEKGSLEELEKLMNEKVIAIGECGLDFSGEYDRNYQEKLFRGQIELAIKYNKPLIIHSRKAMDETMEILNSYQNLRGVVHCYSGGVKRIKSINNFYFGIDGNLTYEDGLIEVVKNIPKDRLVLETDSPYLTPVPHRGEKNYPEYIKFVYQKIAEIWELPFEETEKIIDLNAKRLFKILPQSLL